jgi:hypothetical protein
MENRFTIPARCKRFLRFLFASVAHPEFYTINTEGYLTEGKEAVA